jgi:hypothetical protein
MKLWIFLIASVCLSVSCRLASSPPIVKQEELRSGFRKESDHVMVHTASKIRIPSQLGSFMRVTPTQDIHAFRPSITYKSYSDNYKSGNLTFTLSISPIGKATPQQFKATQEITTLLEAGFAGLSKHYDPFVSSNNPSFKKAKMETKQIGKHKGYIYCGGIINPHSKYYTNYTAYHSGLIMFGFFFKHQGYYIDFKKYIPLGGADKKNRTDQAISVYQP